MYKICFIFPKLNEKFSKTICALIPYHLFIYHVLVMEEMEKRGYHVSAEWKDKNYRGRTAEKYDNLKEEIIGSPIYKEHNIEYLADCIENLRDKGIHLKV